jgi:MFS family permease
MLIIWLQGIWLPLHGYSYEDTPLWAGIYLLPLTVGFLIAGPLSGYLSDKFGARAFASGGLFLVALTFGGLLLLPTDFSYFWFAALIALNGFGSGLFAAPNTAAVMNSVPAAQRGAANGMMSTFQNSGMVLSIGIFFSLMIVGLAAKLPNTMFAGLTANGVPASAAHQIANQPPVGDLFASFLGFNPLGTLLTQAHVTGLTAAQHATLTGKEFFPHLISQPFKHGLVIVFTLAIVMSLISSVVSLLRGEHFVHDDSAAGTASSATTASPETADEAEGELLVRSADNSAG